MLAAATIHVWAAVEHASESLWVAVSFVVIAVAQGAFGSRMLWPVSPRTVRFAAAGSGVVALVWLATRTLHVSILPETPEPVGAADLAATLLEIADVLGATAVRRGTPLRRWAMPSWAASAALATTSFAGTHGIGPVGHGTDLHDFVHLAPVVAAFTLFAYTVVIRSRRYGLSFSLALRPTALDR